MLTDRWYTLRPHEGQSKLFHSGARFLVAACGRRSGKTELAKRKGVQLSLAVPRQNGRFMFAAPTRGQAKEIFWEDLKSLTPSEAVETIYEGTCTIKLRNGNKIQVEGLDRPQRIEGSPLDWICVDECADVRETSFNRHIRPALDTVGRPGAAWLIGVPRGRGYFYKMFLKAKENSNPDWESFSWPSSDILPKEVIDAAKEDLDPLTFAQEYEANFLNPSGRAYYTFDRGVHATRALGYDDRFPLIFCFDFNVDPGIAVVCQDRPIDEKSQEGLVTHCIDEVFIENDSNTERVANKLVESWGHHKGAIEIYGDASGGARRSSATTGTDWDIIKQVLKGAGLQVHTRVPRSNPPIKSRVNALNRRILSGASYVQYGDQIQIDSSTAKPSLLVDPFTCTHLINDLEGVSVIPGSAGEIDKKSDLSLTHLSDALGYFVHRKYPMKTVRTAWSH